MTIDEANTKILRPAMDVVVQVEINSAEISQLTATNAYSQGDVGQTDLIPILMDLSNGGFLNNGAAVPLGDDYIVSRIGSSLIITATTDSTKNLALTAIGYVDGAIKKWQTEADTNTTKTLTIPASDKRIIITSVVIGDIWRFDNSNLVECSGVLRGVETKVENPELQMSEIEIKAYMPNDITTDIGSIGTDHPILYTAGYPGDMSPVRKFYMSEQIEWENGVITIKGTDATRFLDDEFEGEILGHNSDRSNGINLYINAIDDILTDSGIDHEFINEYAQYDKYYSDSPPLLIKKQSKRKVIAQAVNWLRADTSWYDDMPTDEIYLNYVDAGIPKLATGKLTQVKEINGISKPSIQIEPYITQIACTMLHVQVSDSYETIEKVNIGANGSVIKEVSDPYYDFSASSGLAYRFSPYKYVFKNATSATISGKRIYESDKTDTLSFSPWIENRVTDKSGIRVTLDDYNDWFVLYFSTGPSSGYANDLRRDSMWAMFNRSNILYGFEYRGDPRLQPRDYIKADVDGSETLVDMTIDSIEFSHESGGYKQKITARKGLV